MNGVSQNFIERGIQGLNLKTLKEATAMQDEQLNFETTEGIVENSQELQSAGLIPESAAIGMVLGVTVVFFVISILLARKFKVLMGIQTPKTLPSLGKHWHLLSILTCTFLALNLFFGGLSALLLGRTSEDARAYFAEISAFKLAKLSHEHFFGYGVSFGCIVALSFLFVSCSKIRILLPSLLLFFFGALDIASWWLSHFASFGFHKLSLLTGAIFSASFLMLYFQLIRVNFQSIFKNSAEGPK
jgi:hypothetical protein